MRYRPVFLAVCFTRVIMAASESSCDAKSYLQSFKIESLSSEQESRLVRLYSDSDIPTFIRTLSDLNDRSSKLTPNEVTETVMTLVGTAQEALNTLGYGVRVTGAIDANMMSNIRRFQKLAAIKAEGVLTMQTVCLLMDVAGAKDATQFLLPAKSFSWQEGYVTAKGTFRMVNETDANPIQTSEIRCSMEKATCIDTTVLLSKQNISIVPIVTIDEYSIERWEESEIVTKPNKIGLGCVQYVLRVNRVQESVTMLRSTLKTSGLCEGIDKKEYYLQLEDGFVLSKKRNDLNFEKWRKYAPDIAAWAQKVTSSSK